MVMKSVLSLTMRAILAGKLGNMDEVLTMSSECPRPTLDPKGGQMLLRVQACSLNPLDRILITGACAKVMQPPAFPYTPGMDVCGVVEEIEEGAKYKVGDRVIASGGLTLPVGGLAEYMAVDIKSAGLAPANVDVVGAAALPTSPMTAMLATRNARVKAGDRVLVLGGSGGVGTSLVQLVRDAGASFVATTSTDEPLMLSLGVDKVIDYRGMTWWELPEFKEKPFDLVVDCVGWRDEWTQARRHGVLKTRRKGGLYLALANTDDPRFTTVWEGVRMFVPTFWRMLWTFFFPWTPRYKFMLADPIENDWSELTKLVAEERLKPVITPSSPFPFTIKGVKEAFHLLASRRAHGKVVIKMDESTDYS